MKQRRLNFKRQLQLSPLRGNKNVNFYTESDRQDSRNSQK